jgi:hypothetical protein
MLFALALAALVFSAAAAFAEVQLFVSKNTVKVYDPELKNYSVLNDFHANGWKTHNYLALVWDANDAWAYDIRTHEWLPLNGFAAVNTVMSDNYAMIWEPITTVRSPLISRGMGAMLTDAEFVVFDPVLHEWKAFETERAGSGETFDWDAVLGDRLAVCWDDTKVVLYDTTLHQWQEKEIAKVQAALMDEYSVKVFTADNVYLYDAMKHRWSVKERQ